MYKVIQIARDEHGTTVMDCGAFDELDDARGIMLANYNDGFMTELDWGSTPIGNVGDWQAVITGGELYEKIKWVILGPEHGTARV